MAQYKFIDLFSGIGGFHLGFKNSGYECVMSCDIDENARLTYCANHKMMPLGDITKIDMDDIPEHDVLTAGFPCQPFSISGKKQGFSDTRGTMFFYICNIIKDKKPRVVFLENVKFLLHHDGGRTLEVIISSLEDLGYNVSYSLQNSLNFGVPQNRERIIIIATRGKKFDFKALKRQKDYPILKDFLEEECEKMDYLSEDEYSLIDSPVKQEKSGLKFIGYRNKNIRKKGVRENTMHLSRVHKQPNRIYCIYGTHPTLSSQEVSGRFFIYNPHIEKVRKLTLRECYNIMGFPKDFIIHSSRSEAYKQIGNSVCVPMIIKIAEEIKTQILENNDESYNYIRKCVPQQMQLF